jgi:hypothetical protein
MKRTIYIFILLAIFNPIYAQVGIGTNTPDNSSMLQVESTEKGFLLPRMTSTQRSSIAIPASGLQVYDTNTNSIWYFNGTFWVNTQAMASVGDVKSGIQTADHSGWVLLDGRAINTLSSNQQSAAAALVLAGNLPNANNAYLSQNGNPIATVSGVNTTTLTQANLPNVTFSGNTASAGSHTHSGTTSSSGEHTHIGATSNDGSHSHTGTTTTDGNHNHGLPVNFSATNAAWNITPALPGSGFTNAGSASTSNAGNHSHSLNINSNGAHSHSLLVNNSGIHTHSLLVDSSGAHTHTVTVSSGGTATPINIAPQTLSVNMFIYLGL